MKFYEKEGALFRRAPSTYPTAPVDDVWDARNGRWVRFEGDCLKPICSATRYPRRSCRPRREGKPMVSDISNMVDAVWDMEKKRQRVAAEEALRTLARLFMPYRMIVTYPLNERS